MNAHKRMMMIGLIGGVGGVALLLGVYFWFVKPLNQYKASIEKLKGEIETKHVEIDAFQMDRRKLVLARAKSLPNNAAEASKYQIYLSDVLLQSGLSVDEIIPSPAAKMKFQPTIPNIKEVGHQIMSFSVRARGELKYLVAALETLQATPYEHRVKSLSVDRTEMKRESTDRDPKLYINMVIETLLVAQSDSKTGLPPGFSAKYVILDSLAAHGGAPAGWGMLGSLVAIKASMPVPEHRSYYEIAEKNIFTGKLPKYVEPKRPKGEKGPTLVPPKPPEPPPEPVGPYMPKLVYLTHCDPEEQAAYYFNRIVRGEKRIESKPQSGRQQFMIKDDEDEFVYVKGKVLRVDLRAVYFQKEGTIFAWHIGTSLDAALHNPLDIDQRDDLNLKVDEAFAKAAVADTKEKATKKSTKGGYTKGSTKGGKGVR